MKDSKRLWVFVALACMVSWMLAGVMYLTGIEIGTVRYTVTAALYMLIPALIAVLLQKYIYKEEVVKPFRISFKLNWMFAVAVLTPIGIVALSLGVSLLLPGIEFSSTGEGMIERFADTLTVDQQELALEQLSRIPPVVMMLITLGQGILAACTINALFAFGEELGWRGYMLHYLKGSSFAKASLIIGAIWGIWHFPLILMGHNYPDHSVAGVFMMIVFCILLTPLMMYIVLKSKSVITAAVFHGSVNAFAGFPIIYMVGANDLNVGMTGYAGFAAIIFVTLLFVIYDKYVTKENIFGSTINKAYEEETTH